MEGMLREGTAGMRNGEVEGIEDGMEWNEMEWMESEYMKMWIRMGGLMEGMLREGTAGMVILKSEVEGREGIKDVMEEGMG